VKKNPRIPMVKVDSLWHGGDLDIKRKGKSGGLFEGNLFSMSACPNAWRHICKFGGKPLHQSNNTVYLVDSHAIHKSKSHYAKRLRNEIEQWGIERKYLSLESVYIVEMVDDDDETILQYCYLSREEVEVESDDPDAIEVRELLIATETFKAIHGFKAKDVIGSDYVLLDWAKEMTHADGIYWRESYSPSSYSAPRAGLFVVPELFVVNIDRLAEDEMLLNSIGKTTWIGIEDDLSNLAKDPKVSSEPNL
jgi:hypothetical protein